MSNSSIFEKIFAAARALNAGESLKDPAKWKNVQMTMNAVLPIVGALPIFFGVEMTDGQINAIAWGIVTILGVLNPYFTAATSTKVGLPFKSKSR